MALSPRVIRELERDLVALEASRLLLDEKVRALETLLEVVSLPLPSEAVHDSSPEDDAPENGADCQPRAY